jgi:hypothetical protein
VLPCTSWLWGRAVFSDFPIFDFKPSFLNVGCPGASGRSYPGRGSHPPFGVRWQEPGPRQRPGLGLLHSARARRLAPAALQVRPVLLVLVETTRQLARRAGSHLLLRRWAELEEREAAGSDRGRVPLGSEAGRGSAAAPGGLGSGVKVAEPWSPSGGPRSNRGRKSQAALDGRPRRAAPAAGRRQS